MPSPALAPHPTSPATRVRRTFRAALERVGRGENPWSAEIGAELARGALRVADWNAFIAQLGYGGEAQVRA